VFVVIKIWPAIPGVGLLPEGLQAWFDLGRKVSGLPCLMSTTIFDWFDPDGWDDEQLLAVLKASIQAHQAVMTTFSVAA
jgi:hypothetical protein